MHNPKEALQANVPNKAPKQKEASSTVNATRNSMVKLLASIESPAQGSVDRVALLASMQESLHPDNPVNQIGKHRHMDAVGIAA